MNPFFHLSLNRNPPGCRNADVPHTHDHHELLYCTSGEGGMAANQREFPLKAGDLFFFPKGTRHCAVFLPGRKFDCFVLDFQGELFTPALSGDKETLDIVDKMGRFHGKVPISADAGNAVEQILDGLLCEFQRKGTAYHAVMKMSAMRLFITIGCDEEFRSIGRAVCGPVSNDDMIQEVIAYLDAFYMHAVSVDSILEFCPISRSYLHAAFKKATGKTLVQYLRDVRLEKTKELLLDTETPIAEIARSVGFSTSSYFGQTFRSATGMSPGEYRSRNRRDRGQF